MEEGALEGEIWGERWSCLPRRGGCSFPAVLEHILAAHPPPFPSSCPQAQEEAVSGAGLQPQMMCEETSICPRWTQLVLKLRPELIVC